MSTVPFRILVIDDQDGPAGLANVARLAFLEDNQWEIESASDATKGLKAAADSLFDIFVIDIQLQQVNRNGIWVAEQLRGRGHKQPIILVTAARAARKWPIEEYEQVLRSGPTYFYDRSPSQPVDETDAKPVLLPDIIREASGQTDILLRGLRVVKAAGIKQSTITINGQEITADDLLGLATNEQEGRGRNHIVEEARVAMREAMQAMLARGLESKGASKAKKPKGTARSHD